MGRPAYGCAARPRQPRPPRALLRAYERFPEIGGRAPVSRPQVRLRTEFVRTRVASCALQRTLRAAREVAIRIAPGFWKRGPIGEDPCQGQPGRRLVADVVGRFLGLAAHRLHRRLRRRPAPVSNAGRRPADCVGVVLRDARARPGDRSLHHRRVRVVLERLHPDLDRLLVLPGLRLEPAQLDQRVGAAPSPGSGRASASKALSASARSPSIIDSAWPRRSIASST